MNLEKRLFKESIETSTKGRSINYLQRFKREFNKSNSISPTHRNYAVVLISKELKQRRYGK
ncbi:hypothetical protein LCGC14_1747270 [marine sediment metagenome]|uniref:Uncharacterized protein n=1 Tax=marine sediment metagenome TaxID=412755 RepID=A0A0F9HS97_9ZZZZ